MLLDSYLQEVEKMGTPEFLIENLLILARYLLFAGRSGIGKSILATQLMFCFGSGQPWLGFKVKACTCLYINFELPNLQLQPRLKLQRESFKSIIYPPRIESRPFSPMRPDEFESLVCAEPKPGVAIIDSFRHAYPGKINDNDAIAKWVINYQQIAAKHGIGIVIVQNTGKAKPFLEIGSMEESIGASELGNRAVSVLVAVAAQLRDKHGQFGSKASDFIEVHIPKYGCSTKQLTTIELKLNRETLLFTVQEGLNYTPPFSNY